MALKITPITTSEIDDHQDKTLLVEYKSGLIISFQYGEPDERDDASFWYNSDGIGLVSFDPSEFDRVKSIYVVEVA